MGVVLSIEQSQLAPRKWTAKQVPSDGDKFNRYTCTIGAVKTSRAFAAAHASGSAIEAAFSSQEQPDRFGWWIAYDNDRRFKLHYHVGGARMTPKNGDAPQFTQAEFEQAISDWKQSMTPRLVRVAKATAADILDKFASTIKNADIDAISYEAEEAAAAALAQAAGMARDLAITLRKQATGELGNSCCKEGELKRGQRNHGLAIG